MYNYTFDMWNVKLHFPHVEFAFALSTCGMRKYTFQMWNVQLHFLEGDSVPMSIMDCEEVKRTCMLSNVNSLPIKLKVTQKKGRGEDEDEEGENDT